MTGSFIAGFVAFVALALVSELRATVYNNYVLLADALLQGHTWIYWPGEFIDALAYNGRRYVIEAPMPAILLLPQVAVVGTSANQTVLSTVLGGVSVGAAWELARRLGASVSARAWLCAFMFVGTDLFWCAMFGDVWFIAHVSAVAFTLLALVELAGARRGWLVALLGICATESRFSMLLALPVYAVLLALDRTSVERRRVLLSFAGTIVPFVVLWVGYNEARWGLPYDIGYTAWYHQDSAGEPVGSPFKLKYFHYQFDSFFKRFPDVVKHPPYLIPTINGVALTWTSPVLLLALFARGPRHLVIAMWAATILVAGPSFIYYVNGFAQFGMRHALDFEPFLFVLMVLAVRERMPGWGAVLCTYSVLVGIWGIWYWRTFYRT